MNKIESTTPTAPEESAALPANATLSAVFEGLLKNPAALIQTIKSGHQQQTLILKLLGLALSGFLIFGVTLGSFSFGTQLWAAPLKTMLGITLAAVICLPSLYVFSALAGTSLRLPAIVLGLAATLALVAALLLSFTPVLWVFSQSTNSEPFFGFLAIVTWLVSLWFGIGFLLRMLADSQGGKKSPVRIWIGIFLLVTLQMSTSLRPIIGTSEQLFTAEKRFFLEHWLYEMAGRKTSQPGENGRQF